MTRPLDRNAQLPQIGDLDTEGGEFWVENPFQMPGNGQNLSAFERNRLFLNSNGDVFVDGSFASGADIDSDSRSVIVADFDRDGGPDLLVGSVGGGPVRLFLNRFPEAQRTRVELVGTESNRAGIGSRIIATVGTRRLVRDVFPANGGTGQSPADVILGLGSAQSIDQLAVRWPTGKTQVFKGIPAGTRVTLTEGSSEFTAEPLVPQRADAAAGADAESP